MSYQVGKWKQSFKHCRNNASGDLETKFLETAQIALFCIAAPAFLYTENLKLIIMSPHYRFFKI